MSNTGRIEQTTLLTDIQSVVGSNNKDHDWVYHTATIHTVAEDIPVAKIFNYQHIRKFAEETSGFGIISFFLLRGDFFYRLYPYRDNLEISITTKYLSRGGAEQNSKTEVRRFKAIYRDQFNPSPQMSNSANRNIDDLNKEGIVELELELEQLFEEPYRMISIDGSYSGSTVQELLEAACTNRLNSVRVGGKPIVEAIYVEEPHNTTPVGNLIVRGGILVRDFPGWLQEKSVGVYSTGLGNFIDLFKGKQTWFTYPLYSGKERFAKDVEKLIVYFAPQDRFNGAENTYRTEGKLTYVVSATTPPVNFNSFNEERNRGVGFRTVSAEGIMSKPADLTNGVRADPSRLNTEVINRSRPDQMNYARVVGSRTNQYLEMSRVVKNQFQIVNITWEYGDPKLIYPGMPCKCIFMNQGQYEEKYGTVLSCLSVSRVVGNPMTSTQYKRDIELKVSLEPVTKVPTVSSGTVYGDSR